MLPFSWKYNWWNQFVGLIDYNKLRKLNNDENIDVHDNKVEDKVFPKATNQQSLFEAASMSKSKKDKRFDSDDINK